MEQWKKVAWSDESCFLLRHVDGQVCVCHLPGRHMAPGSIMGRRQAGRFDALGNVLTLGPAIHVDVTLICTTYLSIVADYVHHFM